MHIWEACRATSAGVTFFDPIEVAGTTYRDGGLLENNPVQDVDAEASEMFDGREHVLLSIGTGTTSTNTFNPNLVTITDSLVSIALQTEKTAAAFYRRNDSKAPGAGQYHRFNVPGLGDVGLDEAERRNEIRLETEKYLNDPEVGRKVRLCVTNFLEGALGLPKTHLAVPSPYGSSVMA